MAHPLKQTLRAVRRRAWILESLRAIGWTVALVLSIGLLLGLADYVLRVTDQGIRVILWIVLIGTAAWCIIRRLVPLTTFRPNDLQIAQRIEQRFPALAGRLSSSIVFLGQAEQDVTAGSPVLRRTVVAQAVDELHDLNSFDCLDSSPARRAILAAVGAALSIGLLLALDAPSTRLATQRLLAPWRPSPWPRRHELVFQQTPRRLARGDNFEVEVTDAKGELPESVQVRLRFDDQPNRTIAREMTRLGSKMVFRMENVARPFRYRAVGGDDETMGWFRLTVDEAPAISSLSVTVEPPEYTSRKTETAEPLVNALAGSKLRVAAKSSKPLQLARLFVDGARGKFEFPVALSSDQRELTAPAAGGSPWIAQESAVYWFELTDTTGLRGGAAARWEVRITADTPPSILLLNPTGNVFVTSRAIVELRGVVRDDLAIRSVVLHYTTSSAEASSSAVTPLYEGPERSPAPSDTTSSGASLEQEQRPFEYAWDLGRSATLNQGDWIEYSIEATDYKPQTGRSANQRLIIISDEELEDRLAQQQAEILTQLREVLRRQQSTRAQVASLEIQLDETNLLAQRDVDHLQSAELNQRDVKRLLGQDDGVSARIVAVQKALKTNRLDRPDFSQRMEELLGRLSLLSLNELPSIQQELTVALKIARAQLYLTDNETASREPRDLEAVGKNLSRAATDQDSVIHELEQLVDELGQWDNYQRFAREVNALLQEQKSIGQRTDQLRVETLTKRPHDLSSRESADLRRLARGQGELARRVDRLTSGMEEMRRALADDEPFSSATLADTLAAARRHGVSGLMRDSSRSVEQCRLSAAALSQKGTIAGLQEMFLLLSNRREDQLDRMIRSLGEADEQLEDYSRRASEIDEGLQGAAGVADSARQSGQLSELAKRAADLAEDVALLAEQLRQWRAGPSSEAVAGAANRLRRAAQEVENRDAAAGQANLTEARRELSQARELLADAMESARQSLADEQVSQLATSIMDAARRQLALRQRTGQLDARRDAQDDGLTPAQTSALRALSARQAQLRIRCDDIGQPLSRLSAITYVLANAADQMAHAATLLEQRVTDQRTQRAQQLAADRLNQILDAMQSAAKRQEDADGEEQGGDSEEEADEQPPRNPLGLLELQLVRRLQQDLHNQTADALAQLDSNKPPSPSGRDKLRELADQQQVLAVMVIDLKRRLTEQEPE